MRNMLKLFTGAVFHHWATYRQIITESGTNEIRRSTEWQWQCAAESTVQPPALNGVDIIPSALIAAPNWRSPGSFG